MAAAKYTLSPGPGSSRASPHLILSIPWCSKTLKWQVLTSSFTPPSSASCPAGRPLDFIFDDESFQPLLPGYLPDATRLTLAATLKQSSETTVVRHATSPHSCRDDAVLQGVVRLLLKAYLQFQRGQLTAASAGNPRLQFELSTLPPTDGLQLLYMPAVDGDVAKASISIPLESLDISAILAAEAGAEPGAGPGAAADAGSASGHQGPETRPEHFRLNATFRLSDANLDPELQLQAPPWGVAWLARVVLPSWAPHMCLMEYVPLLAEKIQLAINAAAAAVGAKHAFFEALHVALGRPLEYNRTGACAMYQLQYDQVLLLLHVDASAGRFPDDKPLLLVSNVRLLGAGPDAAKTFREYPWSPRWTPQEMAARLHNFLKAELAMFVRTKNPVLAAAAMQPTPGQGQLSPGA